MFKKILFLFSLLMTFDVNAQSLRFSTNDANFYFSSKFLKTAFENSKDNFVVSPLSVYEATALLANGADGNSKIELENKMRAVSCARISGEETRNFGFSN